MGLEELKRKKLRLEVEYLKVEWELVSTEWRQNLITFEQDFKEYLSDNKIDSKKGKVDDIEYDIPKEKVNQVFKKIATKTHPDKTRGSDDSDRLEELYKEAQQSVERNDWSKVTKIAEQLNIDISDIEENDDVYFETTSKKLRQKIKDTQQTLAWLWCHTEGQQKDLVKQTILKTIKKQENKNEKHT